MRFFLKLILVSAAFVAGTVSADPISPRRPHDSHARPSIERHGAQPYGQRKSPMVRTGFRSQSRGYGYRSKRMSADERHLLRNQIREAGRMDFYR
ncbi:MAG: hypothetical protein KIG68_01100 [Oxalobacter sp.]|nr:hypothetical protein [Oxalobacter sp.]